MRRFASSTIARAAIHVASRGGGVQSTPLAACHARLCEPLTHVQLLHNQRRWKGSSPTFTSSSSSTASGSNSAAAGADDERQQRLFEHYARGLRDMLAVTETHEMDDAALMSKLEGLRDSAPDSLAFRSAL